MAVDQIPNDPTDDDYIDMDISSATFFCYSIPPQPNREFEFHMSANPHEKEPTTSPADDLFYKGNLLPLHLPPRLQMVQNLLLQNPNNNSRTESTPYEENLTTNASTPFESCNISPSDSCQVSRELNPDEYFYECQTDNASFIDHPKKSWSKKLKLIKHTSLGLKLKASRAYLKSLFSKSGCSDDYGAADKARNGDECSVSKAKECLNKYSKVAKKIPFGQIHRERGQMTGRIEEGKVFEDGGGHRRSFSGVIKRHSGTKSSSSSSSNSSSDSSISSMNSNGFYGLQLLKRSSSVNSEVESSIQGAIAYCKKSQQVYCSRKSASEVGFCSLSASRISACEKQEWPGMCR